MKGIFKVISTILESRKPSIKKPMMTKTLMMSMNLNIFVSTLISSII